MIPKEIVDRIFETARVEEVIGDFVQLKKAGASFKGLSPFNNERTPSFVVSPSKNIWKDFSSGKGGNAVTFLMEHEHLSFPEALRYLARKYNIEIPEEKELTAEEQAEANERESIVLINTFAQEFFTSQLLETDEGKSIGLGYLKERGFDEKTITGFKLGYCPRSGDAFSKAALAKGYRLEYLETAGLTRQRNGEPYDFYRGRIIFPILSISGRVLGFGARTLQTDKQVAKYYNSPENPVYHKSKVLYGIHQARTAIAREDNCFLVEGYTDVISLHQAGISNTVAASGTALTSEQVRLIRRYTQNITILFDGDAAGIKASFRGIDLILSEGMSVRVVLLPEAHDPDSFARSHSYNELTAYLKENARDFVVFKAEVMMRDAAGDPIRKAAVIKDIVNSIALIPDHITRSVYIQSCSAKLDIEEQALKNELNKLLRSSIRKAGNISEEEAPEASLPAPPQHKPQDAGLAPQEKELLRLLLNYGSEEIEIDMSNNTEAEEEKVRLPVCDVILGELENDNLRLENFLYQRILNEYADFRERDEMPEGTWFTRHDDPHVSKVAVDLLSQPYELSDRWAEKYHIYTIREEQKLTHAVMDGIFTFKLRWVMKTIKQDEELLKKGGEDFDYTPLLERKRKLDQLKIKLAEYSGSTIL